MRVFVHLALMSTTVFAGVNANPRLEKVQSVYILPMGNAMDQFLANRLTRMGRFQVVTDPQAADAILTDRIGEPFEKKLDELYPKPLPAKTEGDGEDTEADTDTDGNTNLAQEIDQMRVHSFARGKGTFFLVDRKTRSVIWSVYERPKNGSANELNRTAERVANQLKKDLKPAPEPQQ